MKSGKRDILIHCQANKRVTSISQMNVTSLVSSTMEIHGCLNDKYPDDQS